MVWYPSAIYILIKCALNILLKIGKLFIPCNVVVVVVNVVFTVVDVVVGASFMKLN